MLYTHTDYFLKTFVIEIILYDILLSDSKTRLVYSIQINYFSTKNPDLHQEEAV